MSTSQKKYKIKKSKIHGKGVFPKNTIQKNETVGVGIYFNFLGIPQITPGFGSMINHSYKPSCRLVYSTKRNIYKVVANKTLSDQDEITVNYKKCPWFIDDPMPWYT